MDQIPRLDLKIVDLAAGMPAALVTQMFARLGASVKRLRPDGDDPFDEIYPAHRHWRQGQGEVRHDAVDEELADADVCLIGGESYPGLSGRHDAAELSSRYPKLVVIDLQGFVSKSRLDIAAVDVLAQAATGIVDEQDLRPTLYSLALASYGATLLALIGALAALIDREASGRGQVVATSMEEGAVLWMQGTWASAERSDHLFNFGTPKGATSSIYRCSDNKYVAQVFGAAGSVSGTYRALGIEREVDPRDPGLPNPARGLHNYFGDRDILEPAYTSVPRSVALAALWKEGVAADAALAPGECWDTEEVAANNLICRHEDGWQSVGLPIRVTSAGIVKRPPNARGSQTGPLSGVRIIDLGAWVAGPFASKFLCDLGAEVIRVETPEGDTMRPLYRHFAAANRGKRNVVLDLKSEEGKRDLSSLVGSADAVVHNLRVGVAERLGVDPESLRRINPSIVTAHLSAYGPVGPKSKNSGFDPILQAFCGHSVRTGGEGNPPIISNAPILDYGSGVLTCVAVLYGLLVRERTGQVVHLDTSLLSAGLYFLSELLISPEGDPVGAPPLNGSRTGFGPFYRLYETKDGWIAVAARTPQQKSKLVEIACAKNANAREITLETCGEELGAAVLTRATDDWLAQFEEAGIYACKVTRDGWSNYQAMPDEAGAIVSADTEERYGRVSGIGHLIRFSRTMPETRLRPVAQHGQETAKEVLA